MKIWLTLSVLLLLSLNAFAQSETCPRVWRSGDSLLTDPASQIQWLRDGTPIPNATNRWLTPTQSGRYSVQATGEPSVPFTYATGAGYVLAGYVFDELHRPVEGATVRRGQFATATDSSGRFSLQINTPKPPTETPVVVTVERDGHWRNASRQYVSSFHTTETRIMLHTKRVTNRVDATKGGEMAYRGFTLQIPPNAVQTEGGSPYSGTILLSVEGSTPSNPDFGLRMPGGDFSAIDVNGNEVMLYSYGYLSAEMTTESGEKLELRPEAQATLRFSLPYTETLRPDSVPLWHFDESRAIWEQEGWSVRNGSIYEGQVSHFSSWNCDWPAERGTCKGRVVDCNEQPVKGGWVRVGQRHVVSDSLGNYWAYVPGGIAFDTWAASDTLRNVSVPPQQERTLDDLTGRDFGGAAYWNPQTQTLKVYLSGNVPDNLRLSLDGGRSWTAEREFSGITEAPSEIRLEGGCTNRIRVLVPSRKEDCRRLSDTEFNTAARYESWEAALSAQENVYRLHLNQGIFSNQWETLEFFPCLQGLELRNNQLVGLPEIIGNYSNLRWLDINRNLLDSLPQCMASLTYLSGLNLSQNNLRSLPQSIQGLASLHMLELSGNQLTILPESIGELRNLSSLWLSSNQLTSLPESINNLEKLQVLWLINNRLSVLPESIGNLRTLSRLVIDKNNLSNLPESFRNLISLYELSLGENQLTSLPESISTLPRLQILSLDSNQLTDLPTSITNLADSLRQLNLRNNPIPVERRAAIQAMLPNTAITW